VHARPRRRGVGPDRQGRLGDFRIVTNRRDGPPGNSNEFAVRGLGFFWVVSEDGWLGWISLNQNGH